jgi:hypothetical protein
MSTVARPVRSPPMCCQMCRQLLSTANWTESINMFFQLTPSLETTHPVIPCALGRARQSYVWSQLSVVFYLSDAADL